MRYHAAGAFDRLLRFPGSLDDEPEPIEPYRLYETLERFQRMSQGSDISSHGTCFNELLAWVVSASRRGDSSDVLSRKTHAHLCRLFPSLVIGAKGPLLPGDPLTTFRVFDLEFRSNAPLTSADRRFLRASAQLISLLDKAGKATDSPGLPQEIPSSDITQSATEWLNMCRSDVPLAKSIDTAHKNFWKPVAATSRTSVLMPAMPST